MVMKVSAKYGIPSENTRNEMKFETRKLVIDEKRLPSPRLKTVGRLALVAKRTMSVTMKTSEMIPMRNRRDFLPEYISMGMNSSANGLAMIRQCLVSTSLPKTKQRCEMAPYRPMENTTTAIRKHKIPIASTPISWRVNEAKKNEPMTDVRFSSLVT